VADALKKVLVLSRQRFLPRHRVWKLILLPSLLYPSSIFYTARKKASSFMGGLKKVISGMVNSHPNLLTRFNYFRKRSFLAFK
jgi:hypothetical protein